MTREKNKMKSQRPVFGIEWNYRISQSKDGRWAWKVYQYRREMDSGHAKTSEACESAAFKRIGELAIEGAKTEKKYDMVSRLMYQYRKKRPFVLAHVLQCLSIEDEDLRSKESCVGSAEESERDLHDKTHPQWRVPISEHHLSKPAEEIAAKFWDACAEAGIVGKKANKKGENTFGYWWIDPAIGGVWGKVNGVWNAIGPGQDE